MLTDYEKQLEILESKLKVVPENTPNKGLWESLFHILTFLGGTLSRLDMSVHGDNNGKIGLAKRMDTVEGITKVIQSDVRETMNMIREMGGYKHYTKDVHPGRREEDQEKENISPADKLLNWFVNKVLPGIAQTAIISLIVTLSLLVILHYMELITLR